MTLDDVRNLTHWCVVAFLHLTIRSSLEIWWSKSLQVTRSILKWMEFSLVLNSVFILSGTFMSGRIVSNQIMLHRLYYSPSNTLLKLRLTHQCTFSYRYPDTLKFFDTSHTRTGGSPFINRGKSVSKLILFQWTHLSHDEFKRKIKYSYQFMLVRWRYFKCL